MYVCSYEIEILFQDLWDVRISKLRTSVDFFIKTGGTHARLDYLTVAEINSMRPLLPHALDFMDRLANVSILSEDNLF